MNKKTENALKRVLAACERAEAMLAEGRTFDEVAEETGYGRVYIMKRYREYLIAKGAQPIRKSKKDLEKAEAALPPEPKPYRTQDIGLVVYLSIKSFGPMRVESVDQTFFPMFVYADSDLLQASVDGYYGGAMVCAEDYAATNRRIFALVKRYNRGEEVRF